MFDPLAVMMLIAWNREIALSSETPPTLPNKPTITPSPDILNKVSEVKSEIKEKLKNMFRDGNAYLERKRKERQEQLRNEIVNTSENKPTAFYKIDNVDRYSDIKETITRPLDGRPEQPKNSVIPKKE